MSRSMDDTVAGAATQQPFPEYLQQLQSCLKNVFHVRADVDQISLRRGLPPFVLREIMTHNPMAAFIPTEYGGRGGHIHEGLAVAAAASYESLALSLTFGINWALFLQPVAKYGAEELKPTIFKDFLQNQKMGGLMITEPDFGSDALHMQTAYSEVDGCYHLQGTKHWAGLTGWADYWLLTARKKTATGDLMRDIDFFVCNVNGPGQQIVVEEFYENLGLYMIPYGRNRIDVKIPTLQRLVPHSSGIKMMLDLLHRSRMQFPGMATGFVQRMLDEGLAHCRDRLVGGKSLTDYDQVQHRLARLQGAFTICSAMCHHSSHRTDISNDLAPHGLEANAIKTVATDLMQEASQSLLQLVGAKGYRLDHIAGRGTVDSRPFQIFEGSNDILYIQIAEAVLKLMKRASEYNLHRLLASLDLTRRAAEQTKKPLDIEIQPQLAQRKLTELGRVIGRAITLGFVIDLGDNGFRADLIENALSMLKQDIAAQMGAYANDNPALVVTEYQENSAWLELVEKR